MENPDPSKIKLCQLLDSSQGGVPTVMPGTVLGHEATGVVEEVGSSVTNIRPGDRILAVYVSAYGYCRFSTSGMYEQCLNGGWALGHTIDGVQAEYARIPFARNSVYKIPHNLITRFPTT
jgi:alcohol dehydrogenase